MNEQTHEQSQTHKLDTQDADMDRVIFYSYKIRVEGEDKDFCIKTITPTIEGVRDRLSNMIPETTLTSIEQLENTNSYEQDVENTMGNFQGGTGSAEFPVNVCPVCKKLDAHVAYADAYHIILTYLCTIHRFEQSWDFGKSYFLHPDNIDSAELIIMYEDLVDAGFKNWKHFSCE